MIFQLPIQHNHNTQLCPVVVIVHENTSRPSCLDVGIFAVWPRTDELIWHDGGSVEQWNEILRFCPEPVCITHPSLLHDAVRDWNAAAKPWYSANIVMYPITTLEQYGAACAMVQRADR